MYNDQPLSTGPLPVEVIPVGQRPTSRPDDEITPQLSRPQEKAPGKPLHCKETNVKVDGPALFQPVCDEPTYFVVDMTESGPGSLGFGIKGPSKVELKPRDIGNGTVKVDFIPRVPGEYTIEVMYNDKPLSTGPIKTTALPAGMKPTAESDQLWPQIVKPQQQKPTQCPKTKVKVDGPAFKNPITDVTTNFVVDMTESGPGKLDFKATGPSQTEMIPKKLDDNKVQVDFTPNAPGEYLIEIIFNDEPLSTGPVCSCVVPVGSRPYEQEPSKRCPQTGVELRGVGIYGGIVNQTSTIVVDTAKSGPGALNFGIKGPGEAELVTEKTGNDQIELSFVPTELGEYILEIYFKDQLLFSRPIRPHVVRTEEELDDLLKDRQYDEYKQVTEHTTTDDGLVDTTTTTTMTRHDEVIGGTIRRELVTTREIHSKVHARRPDIPVNDSEIGRASCRERV